MNGDDVGQVNYNDIGERQGKRRTELDIWLRSEKDCGQGFGTDALLTLSRYLFHHFGVQEFMVQPSARNPRAIRAYEKAGFVQLPLSIGEAEAQWGASDYFDSVYMVKTISRDEGRG
jgi:RimJ/RimL family protein N-acetyltransferase